MSSISFTPSTLIPGPCSSYLIFYLLIFIFAALFLYHKLYASDSDDAMAKKRPAEDDGRAQNGGNKDTSTKKARKESYSSAQKNAIAQFAGMTNVERTSAARWLKQANWDVEAAVNNYFNQNDGGAAPVGKVSKTSLNKLFDSLRDVPGEEPDTIEMEGTMDYFTQLGINMAEENIGLLVASEAVRSPAMGEISREGFVEGWTSCGADTIDKQKSFIQRTLETLPTAPNHFTKLYKFTFLFARGADSKVKSVPLDVAVPFWRVLFSSSASPVKWNTPSTPFLEWWIEYLEGNWKKGVNKDMWDQTLKFAQECLKDESLSWWSEESAWPGVVDEFVEFVKERRPKNEQGKEDEDMDEY